MIDKYNRNITYLRLSVTDKCNLRCKYCMPENGVCNKSHSDMLTEEEMILAVRAAASLGISKLRITGGEPLIKKNILSICEKSAAVSGIDEVCLTTNGILLPQMAKDLYKSGVTRLNISLDTLDRNKYKEITRLGNLDQALLGIEAALDAGFKQVKINSVLIGGFNDNEVINLAELTKKYPVDVRFIELMPMLKTTAFDSDAFLPSEYVLSAIPNLTDLNMLDGVARLYRLPDALGNVGIISAISNHFCASCNRIRLTADGKLKPCLHSNQEFGVKGLDFDGMRAEMIKTIELKPPCHEPMSATKTSNAGRNMNLIGG